LAAFPLGKERGVFSNICTYKKTSQEIFKTIGKINNSILPKTVPGALNPGVGEGAQLALVHAEHIVDNRHSGI
jgi:hypothetical protein